jgi:multiple sugar transport system substrate-binding protein
MDHVRHREYRPALRRVLDKLQAVRRRVPGGSGAGRLSHHLELAVRGDVTLDAALAALDADVDAILEKRRWLRARRKG